MPRDASQALTDFGFTALESEIYAFLLRESPATGYRIAQGINKPVANTYKAIQTLQAKGGILVEEGDSRLCRAVNSDELLGRIARQFEARRAAAQQAFQRLGQPEADERIYQLRSRMQVMERAREMLGEAKQVVLGCASGLLANEVADDLRQAAARGVEVTVKTDAEITLARVESYVATRADDLLNKAPGLTLRLVVDGEQHLTALLDPDGEVMQAYWSRSPLLALAHHEGLAAEISMLAVAERIEEGAGPKRLAKALTTTRAAASTSGAARLAR